MIRFAENLNKMITAGLGGALEAPSTEVAYPIATPTALTLTPASLSTLKGQNNVWSDAGDVALEYPHYEETEGY